MDGLNTSFLLGRPIFRAMLVLGRVVITKNPPKGILWIGPIGFKDSLDRLNHPKSTPLAKNAHHTWSNYSDLTRPIFPQMGAKSKGNGTPYFQEHRSVGEML